MTKIVCSNLKAIGNVVAYWYAHQTSKTEVSGSNPASATNDPGSLCHYVENLRVERETYL